MPRVVLLFVHQKLLSVMAGWTLRKFILRFFFNSFMAGLPWKLSTPGTQIIKTHLILSSLNILRPFETS